MKNLLAIILVFIGATLTTINTYGLFKSIRPNSFETNDLRFQNDIIYDYREVTSLLVRKPNENDLAFSSRANSLVSKGVAHIWWQKSEPEKYSQLIPIWENYFLYFMGVLSGIPEYQRYHFASYEKSLERGIGVCGDASMILSQVLSRNGIENQIVSFPRHVVVSAQINGKEMVFDPDFGLALKVEPDELMAKREQIAKLYRQAGYTEKDEQLMLEIYNTSYKRWRDVKHFITKKYYFEKLSYTLKWPLPISLLVAAWLLLRRRN